MAKQKAYILSNKKCFSIAYGISICLSALCFFLPCVDRFFLCISSVLFLVGIVFRLFFISQLRFVASVTFCPANLHAAVWLNAILNSIVMTKQHTHTRSSILQELH